MRGVCAFGAWGRLGERLLYSLTPRGRKRFQRLLADEVATYETVHTGVEVGIVFLAQVPRRTALALLRKRRESIQSRRRLVQAAFGDVSGRRAFTQIAADHLLSLIEAESAWVERSLKLLSAPRRRSAD